MSETPVSRYWCHACHQVVNPAMEPELKCPSCDLGFVEEMESRGYTNLDSGDQFPSLLAPIMLEIIANSQRPSPRRDEEDEDSDVDDNLEGFLRRWLRPTFAAEFLQSLRDEFESELDRERERESQTPINAFNQGQESNNSDAGASLGDYLVGAGLDMLLQHLAENDPSRYGTPPAKKEAIDALPTVKIEEAMCCSVCLDGFVVGMEAKEMPCKHKFHSDCILPWLELHSSCPVCRFQLPADESKASSESINGGGDRDDDRFWLPVPWPFNDLFSALGSQNGGNSSSSNAASSSSSGNNLW